MFRSTCITGYKKNKSMLLRLPSKEVLLGLILIGYNVHWITLLSMRYDERIVSFYDGFIGKGYILNNDMI